MLPGLQGSRTVFFFVFFNFTSQVQTGSWPSYMKAKDRICQNPNEQQHRAKAILS